MTDLEVSCQTHTPAQMAELLEEYRSPPALKAWLYYQTVPAAAALKGHVDQQFIRDLYNSHKMCQSPELVTQLIAALKELAIEQRVADLPVTS